MCNLQAMNATKIKSHHPSNHQVLTYLLRRGRSFASKRHYSLLDRCLVFPEEMWTMLSHFGEVTSNIPIPMAFLPSLACSTEVSRICQDYDIIKFDFYETLIFQSVSYKIT